MRMAEFFDKVIKDVELYQTAAGTDTSEPVTAVHVNNPVATANANVDSLVDSLTVWSRTHTDVQHPAGIPGFSENGELLHDDHVEVVVHEPVDEGASWISHQVDRALQEAHFVNSRNTAPSLPWESGVFATLCPLDWPSNYSLLRLWHMHGSLQKTETDLRAQTGRNHMFASWTVHHHLFAERVLFRKPPMFEPLTVLQDHIRNGLFPNRRLRTRPQAPAIEAHRAALAQLRQDAMAHQQTNPVEVCIL